MKSNRETAIIADGPAGVDWEIEDVIAGGGIGVCWGMNADRRFGIAVGLALGSLLLSGTGVVAQTKASETVTAAADSLTVGNKRYDAEKELARLAKRYSLTEQQKTKIQPILLEQQKRVHTLGEDEALSDSEYAGAVRKVHLQTVAKVKLQLTDAQASKYAKDEAKRAKSSQDDADDDGDDGPPPDGPPPGGGPGGGPGGPGGGGPGGGGPPGE